MPIIDIADPDDVPVDGTPTAGAAMLYLDDPAGTPRLKLTDYSPAQVPALVDQVDDLADDVTAVNDRLTSDMADVAFTLTHLNDRLTAAEGDISALPAQYAPRNPPLPPSGTPWAVLIPKRDPFVTTSTLPDRMVLVGAIVLDRDRVLSALHIDIPAVVGDGAAVVRFAVARHNSTTGVVEGEALAELGSVDATTTGAKALTGLSHAMPAGVWSFYTLVNGEASVVPQLRQSAPDLPPGYPVRVAGSTSLLGRTALCTGANHPGAFPATVPMVSVGLDASPIVVAEFSA